jgi:hypothetical protein
MFAMFSSTTSSCQWDESQPVDHLIKKLEETIAGSIVVVTEKAIRTCTDSLDTSLGISTVGN